MRNRILAASLMFGGLWLVAGPVEAAGVTCTNAGVVRCICEASMMVQCGTNSGMLLNTVTPQTVSLRITMSDGSTRRLVLERPSTSVRAFYGAGKTNADVAAGLQAAGINPAQVSDVSLGAFVIADNTPLYSDHEGRSVSGTAGGGAATASAPSDDEEVDFDPSVHSFRMISCTSATPRNNLERTRVLNDPSCGSEGGLCLMRGNCTYETNYPQGGAQRRGTRNQTVVCPAINAARGQCPRVEDCYADTRIQKDRVGYPLMVGQYDTAWGTYGSGADALRVRFTTDFERRPWAIATTGCGGSAAQPKVFCFGTAEIEGRPTVAANVVCGAPQSGSGGSLSCPTAASCANSTTEFYDGEITYVAPSSGPTGAASEAGIAR